MRSAGIDGTHDKFRTKSAQVRCIIGASCTVLAAHNDNANNKMPRRREARGVCPIPEIL
jgi:hypothetical protein